MRRFRASHSSALSGLLISGLFIFGGFTGSVRAEDQRPVVSPEWIRGASVYEVSLRSFSPDSRFFTFEERLMKLKNWGADAVCLAPIFAVSEEKSAGVLGDARAVRDFGAFNYEFGTRDAFKTMMDQARYAGIKVLLTWVADSTSREHPWVKDRPEWYVKNSSSAMSAEYPDLALLDLSNPDLQDGLIKIMLSWVSDYGMDGFKIQRVGTGEAQDRAWLEFCSKARKALAAAKKDFVLISAEPSPEAHLRAFDVTPSGASRAFLKGLISGAEKPERFEAFIKEEEKAFPAGSLRARYLETLHSERARTEFGPAQRAAAAFNATIPGVMWVVNGEEAAEAKTLPLKAKAPIDWKGGDAELIKFYRSLLKLRRNHPAMSRGQVFQVRVPDGEKVLAYARTYRDDAVLVVINFSDREWKGSIDAPEIFKSGKGALNLEAALTDSDFKAGQLTLPPYGCQVFTAK